MGKFDWLDRLAQALLALAGIFSIANGGFMLIAPLDWYVFVPTLVTTGPPNAHFIRDIALAYVGSGILLLYAMMHPQLRWRAALVGVLWISLHGILHIYEVLAGICGPAVFWADFPGVIGVPALVWITLGILFARGRVSPAGIPIGIFLKRLDRLTRGDAGYAHDIAAGGGKPLEKFQHFMPVTSHRHHADPAPFHAARLAAALVADCGPCAIICAHSALADGVARDLVNALLSSAPPVQLADAFAFGGAIARHDAIADTYGGAVEAAYGRQVRMELALTAATVTAYPAIKRGLGYASACSLHRLQL